MDRQEWESRRALNQIWNGAGRYTISPELEALDTQGNAALYFNTVLGLAWRYYDVSRFQPMLHAFQQQPCGELYTDLFWMGLESALYTKELPKRLALAALRQQYAELTLEQCRPGAERESLESLRRAWAQRILGQAVHQDSWYSAVLDALTFSPDWDEQELVRKTEEVLFRYFHRARRSMTDRQWAAWAGRSITKNGGIHLVRPNALRALARGTAPNSVGAGKGGGLLSFLQGRTPEPVLRRYVEDCFGVSALSPDQLAEAQHELCTGVHRNCRLHVTRGVPPKRQPSPEAAWDAEHFRRQRQKNRAYYQAHLAQNRMTIAQLTQKLQNTLLLQQEEDTTTALSGRLQGSLAWRVSALGEERIFSRNQPNRPGELSVDILLDGSASQNRQQEKLAAQAYLIVESLSRCHIPARVTAFCSVSGCTVMQLLRDYDHPEENDRVFDYVAAGWNRDGLALRTMGWLMRHSTCENRLLIILSDASPNDDQRIPVGALPLGGYSYCGKRGVQDTADEAAALRRQGIQPVCIFTGSDQELDSARKIYGHALERIPTVGWFADALTRLIRGQLHGL